MKNLRIKSLSILSTKMQSGNHFVFYDNVNLIQSASNARGKSTLINLIYWTLGCNVQLDSWAKVMFCRVDFMIDNTLYSAFRTPNSLFYLQNGEKLEKFEELGKYQAALNQLFCINIRLKDHNGNIRNARPAHYFATSYISQEKGWNDFFTPPFDGIGEFKKYKKPLVEQFTYRYPAQLSELELQLQEVDFAIQKIKTQKDGIIILKETLAIENSLDSKVIPFSEDYQCQLNDLNQQLDAITLNQISLKEKIEFIQKEAGELDKDYQFAVNIDGPIICPQCGATHKNGTNEAIDLAAYASALTSYLGEYEKEYNILKAEAKKLAKEIELLKKQHLTELGKIIETENSALFNGVTLKSIVQLEQRFSNDQESLTQKKNNINKELTKQKREMKKERETADKYFIARLKHYADELGLSLKHDNIKSPADYSKVRKNLIDAGAADKNRGILAYYLAIYETAMKNSSCDMLPPLVVDTPMQNDQDPENYQAILKILATQQHKQIFVCLINTGTLLNEYPNLHRITLNKDLTADKFDETKIYFNAILSIV